MPTPLERGKGTEVGRLISLAKTRVIGTWTRAMAENMKRKGRICETEETEEKKERSGREGPQDQRGRLLELRLSF